MRDWKQIDKYLTQLTGDIYEQPEDTGHTELARSVIDRWMSGLPSCKSVLDVGAGQGFCQDMFEKWGVVYTGVALGSDVIEAEKNHKNIARMDYNFLEFEDESFDLVFSRHSLEHSFSPLISLMEWQRVARNWLGLVVPAPEYYTYKGRNHYYVLNMEQWYNLFDKSGWHPIWNHITPVSPESSIPMEYCIFCEKTKRKIT